RSLDFENVVLVEPMNLHDGARWIGPGTPQFLLDLVGNRTEPKHVGDVDDNPHAIAQCRALRLRDQLHVEKSLTNPGFVALDERIGPRIDSSHSGDIDEIARSDRNVPSSGRLDGAGGQKR